MCIDTRFQASRAQSEGRGSVPRPSPLPFLPSLKHRLGLGQSTEQDGKSRDRWRPWPPAGSELGGVETAEGGGALPAGAAHPLVLSAQPPSGEVYRLELDTLETVCHATDPTPLANCSVRQLYEHVSARLPRGQQRADGAGAGRSFASGLPGWRRRLLKLRLRAAFRASFSCPGRGVEHGALRTRGKRSTTEPHSRTSKKKLMIIIFF